MTKEERLLYFYEVKYMRPYIKSAFQRLGMWQCALCGGEPAEIDHKRYGPDITIFDLQPLCRTCHAIKTSAAQEAHLAGDYCPYCQRAY